MLLIFIKCYSKCIEKCEKSDKNITDCSEDRKRTENEEEKV
jgi:hypothetical protein